MAYLLGEQFALQYPCFRDDLPSYLLLLAYAFWRCILWQVLESQQVIRPQQRW